MEIERKWLLNDFPVMPIYQSAYVEQGYISIDPEVRIRKLVITDGYDKGTTNFLLTVKNDGDLAREEIEDFISEEFYESLKKFIDKPMINKNYRFYRQGGYMVETCEVDYDKPGSFIYSEVEFESIDEANKYIYPFYNVIEEVTDNPKYRMKNYWNRTRLGDNT